MWGLVDQIKQYRKERKELAQKLHDWLLVWEHLARDYDAEHFALLWPHFEKDKNRVDKILSE